MALEYLILHSRIYDEPPSWGGHLLLWGERVQYLRGVIVGSISVEIFRIRIHLLISYCHILCGHHSSPPLLLLYFDIRLRVTWMTVCFINSFIWTLLLPTWVWFSLGWFGWLHYPICVYQHLTLKIQLRLLGLLYDHDSPWISADILICICHILCSDGYIHIGLHIIVILHRIVRGGGFLMWFKLYMPNVVSVQVTVALVIILSDRVMAHLTLWESSMSRPVSILDLICQLIWLAPKGYSVPIRIHFLKI